jgi:putative redox protein
MAEKMTARVKLEANLRFDAQAGSGHQVVLDAAEDGGGHNTGFRPMELLLVGLAGCTGMDVISILRKKRQQVTAYEVHVEGIRAEDHPMVFTEIGIEYIITGHHVQPEAVIRAIQLSAERYCGAGAMLGKVARITHTFRIVDAAQSQAVTAAPSQAVAVTTV